MLCSDYHRLLSRPRSTVVMVTSLSYGKNRNFDPCKIRTLKQIVTKIVKIDDVKERNVFLNVYSILVKCVHRTFWANW